MTQYVTDRYLGGVLSLTRNGKYKPQLRNKDCSDLRFRNSARRSEKDVSLMTKMKWTTRAWTSFVFTSCFRALLCYGTLCSSCDLSMRWDLLLEVELYLHPVSVSRSQIKDTEFFHKRVISTWVTQETKLFFSRTAIPFQQYQGK